MHEATNWKPRRGVQKLPDQHINKRLALIVIGLMSAFLCLSLTACAGQHVVYKTIPAPKMQLPNDWTTPLAKPNCLFQSNANLGECILMQNGVIERANADRAAIRHVMEKP